MTTANAVNTPNFVVAFILRRYRESRYHPRSFLTIAGLMISHSGSDHAANEKLPFVLFVIFFAMLWIAGGASRADVFGQSVVRATSWAIVFIMAWWGGRVDWRRNSTAAGFLAACIILTIVQLIPLPPAIWTALPGRDLFMRAAEALGQPQPWRPLSIAPGMTWNALSSLIVPVVAFILLTGLPYGRHNQIARWVLIAVVAAASLAVLEITGARV